MSIINTSPSSSKSRTSCCDIRRGLSDPSNTGLNLQPVVPSNDRISSPRSPDSPGNSISTSTLTRFGFFQYSSEFQPGERRATARVSSAFHFSAPPVAATYLLTISSTVCAWTVTVIERSITTPTMVLQLRITWFLSLFVLLLGGLHTHFYCSATNITAKQTAVTAISY